MGAGPAFDADVLEYDDPNMTRGQIEKAIERNQPFVLKMAGGNEYSVPHRDYIALPPKAAYVVVFNTKDEGESFDVLPLLTMTGLHQNVSNGSQGANTKTNRRRAETLTTES